MTDMRDTKTVPFEHQLIALIRSENAVNYALFMEQGTGKTKVAIDTAAHLYKRHEITALIVIAPSGVDINWKENEIPAHMSENVAYKILLHRSSRAKTGASMREREIFFRFTGLKILVMMPEALMTDIGAGIAESVLYNHRTLMIVDESGKLLKNHKAQRTKTLIKYGKMAAYRRILTGTPITKSPLDLYAQFYFLAPDLLGFTNYYSFRNYFAETTIGYGGSRNFITVTGYKNTDRLIELAEPHSFRVLKKDCLDLPPKVYEKVYYELGTEQRKLYDDLRKNDAAFPGLPESENDLFELLAASKDAIFTDNILKKLLRLQQIVGGNVPLESGNTYRLFDDPLKNPRIKMLLEIVEEASDKIIIWSRFCAEIKELKKLFGDIAATYYGEMSADEREQSMREFRTVKKCRFLLANPSMGYGWTMNEATTVIYYSNDFNLEHRLQSEDRCHRAGQKNRVTYFDLIAENTIDQHILQNLQKKMEYSKLLDNLNKKQE